MRAGEYSSTIKFLDSKIVDCIKTGETVYMHSQIATHSRTCYTNKMRRISLGEIVA